jgi:hypothetical protein
MARKLHYDDIHRLTSWWLYLCLKDRKITSSDFGFAVHRIKINENGELYVERRMTEDEKKLKRKFYRFRKKYPHLIQQFNERVNKILNLNKKGEG